MAITANAPASLPDKVMDGLNSARAILESRSDCWTTMLEVATAFVVVGVLFEVVATWMEVRGEKELKLHHILTFVGAGIIALAVAVEGLAELKGSVIETDLRSNNSASQGELDRRARVATATAVKAAEDFGGLQKLVNQKEKDVRTSLASLNKEEEKLRAADKRVEDDLAKVHARELPRHISPDQAKSMIAALRKYGGTQFQVIPELAPNNIDSEQEKFARNLAQVLIRSAWVPNSKLYVNGAATAPLSDPIGDRGCFIVSGHGVKGITAAANLEYQLRLANIDCENSKDELLLPDAVEIDIGLQ